MKRKYVFSIGIVIALAALSVVAFASILTKMPEDKTTVSATVTVIQPETTTEPRHTVAEVTPTERPTEVPYQSIVASMKWSGEESYLLAKIAMAEAEGEDTEGKALVIMVVLNRMQSNHFPGTIEEVILEEHGGIYQFSVAQKDGRWWKVEPNADCFDAVEMVMAGWDESKGALYFESKGKSTWHQDNLNFLFRYGNHYFYTDRS